MSVDRTYEIVTLGPGDIDRIMALEATAFEAEMRATEATVLKRFALGHRMLGADAGERLVGTISFSFITFSPDDPSAYPTTFEAHSTQPIPPEPNTICLYSLGADPSARQVLLFRDLLESALAAGRDEGLVHAVADGQLPSFNGNEQVKARLEIRDTVERYLATGRMPEDEDLLHDPALAMYRRLTGCTLLRMLPDFIPEDTASGGWRVLLYRLLTPPVVPEG